MNTSRAYARIDLEALKYNIDIISRRNPDAQIMAVIKADAYGHGAVAAAKALEEMPYVWGYAVATVDEAIELRRESINKPILLLGAVFPDEYEYVIRLGISMALYSREDAGALSREVLRIREADNNEDYTARVHIKVDTGMSRLGIKPDDEGLELVRYVSDLPGIAIEGAFTHFPRADEADRESIFREFDIFTGFIDSMCESGADPEYVHCANSAMGIRFENPVMNLIRVGIVAYGMWPSDVMEEEAEVELKPVLSLKSTVVEIKTIDAGVSVSYGGTYTADKPTDIATISIGYADGYPRSLSNKGSVLIRGMRAPVVGRVCMDYIMADVTHIPDVKRGDEVTLIGRDGDEEITAEEVGRLSGRFNYELMCCISKRVPRVYV